MAKRRILSSLGHEPKSRNGHAGVRRPRALDGKSEEERQAAIAQARQKNPQAFAPWTREEEQEISKRFRPVKLARHRGDSVCTYPSGLAIWQAKRDVTEGSLVAQHSFLRSPFIAGADCAAQARFEGRGEIVSSDKAKLARSLPCRALTC
jgi:hypothetical protein